MLGTAASRQELRRPKIQKHTGTAPRQFWRLNQPDYASDYADTFINGDLEHPFSLPGVKCERCGETWGGTTILPYELPIHLHSLRSLRDHWPISGSEPEDLFPETGPLLDPLQVPPYYELVVMSESSHPPWAEPQAVSDLCGRETYDSSARQLVMEPEMWNGDDIFFLRTTLWIVVTDPVKTFLESLRPTNLAFTAMSRAVK